MESPDEERRLEEAVLGELARQPLFALELASAMREDSRAVGRAVMRLEAAGLVHTPVLHGRFALA